MILQILNVESWCALDTWVKGHPRFIENGAIQQTILGMCRIIFLFRFGFGSVF